MHQLADIACSYRISFRVEGAETMFLLCFQRVAFAVAAEARSNVEVETDPISSAPAKIPVHLTSSIL